LTYGVAGINVPDDEKLRRKRHDSSGGATSQRDSNINTV